MRQNSGPGRRAMAAPYMGLRCYYCNYPVHIQINCFRRKMDLGEPSGFSRRGPQPNVNTNQNRQRDNCARFKQFFVGYMNQVKITEILRFPSDDGVLFNHVWGKTLRDGDNNVFGIKRNPQTKICPQCSGKRTLHGSGSATKDQQTIFEFSRLDWIQHEMEANAGKSFQMQINLPALASISCQIQSNRQNTKLAYLTRGHLLNPTTPQGGILDAPFSSIAAEVRLKRYLWEMGSDNGETLEPDML